MSSNSQVCTPCLAAPKSCPVAVGNTICGETNSLEIMKEFNKMYEDRMERMDTEAGGECLGEKIKLQQEWIRNLTQQNEMLVKAVQELEYEATDRVQQLEEKLRKSAQCICEVMKKYRDHDFIADLLAEPLQKIGHLEHDLENVLEFVRRARETKNWNLDGLFFYNVSKHQLLGTLKKTSFENSNEGEKKLLEKDKTVLELSGKIETFSSSLGNLNNLSMELEMRKKECDSLKQKMADMRQALTEEVATKHDQTVALKKELQQLEERCVQADKQTAFKEDIIKELRKEIKQLKQQMCVPEKPSTPSQNKLCSKQTQVSQTKLEKPDQPFIVVNHTSRKQIGKNTVIYINKDGTVRREVKNAFEQDHAASCVKCKGKFTIGSVCKSETDLIARAKNDLRPVQQRGKFTKIDSFEDRCDCGDNQFIPVKMHVDQIERGANF